MDKGKIHVLGNRILTRPLKVPNKYDRKKSKVVTPESARKKNQDQHVRMNYDDHKNQAQVQRVGLMYRLRTLLIPKKHKITVGDIVYYIGGDGFPVIQDDKDFLVLETKRIIGINEKGRQGYDYLNFKDLY
jgi:co-chaperonin GroES (HSP10)